MSETPSVLAAGDDADEPAPSAPGEKAPMRTSEVVALVERAYDGAADDRSPIWTSDSPIWRSHRACVAKILCAAISDLSDLVVHLNAEPAPALAGSPAAT